jgi:hypothetical protein
MKKNLFIITLAAVTCLTFRTLPYKKNEDISTRTSQTLANNPNKRDIRYSSWAVVKDRFEKDRLQNKKFKKNIAAHYKAYRAEEAVLIYTQKKLHKNEKWVIQPSDLRILCTQIHRIDTVSKATEDSNHVKALAKKLNNSEFTLEELKRADTLLQAIKQLSPSIRDRGFIKFKLNTAQKVKKYTQIISKTQKLKKLYEIKTNALQEKHNNELKGLKDEFDKAIKIIKNTDS